VWIGEEYEKSNDGSLPDKRWATATKGRETNSRESQQVYRDEREKMEDGRRGVKLSTPEQQASTPNGVGMSSSESFKVT
jgi:hypothetical protein